MSLFYTRVPGATRRLVLLLVLAVAPALAYAADEALIVTYKNNQTYSYVLANRPMVTFDDTRLFITGADIDDSHMMKDVKTFTFRATTAIQEVAADERRIVFTDNATVTLQGFTAGTNVAVWNIAGQNVLTSAVAADGTAALNISHLASGTYIVATADGKSFKILKR